MAKASVVPVHVPVAEVRKRQRYSKTQEKAVLEFERSLKVHQIWARRLFEGYTNEVNIVLSAY